MPVADDLSNLPIPPTHLQYHATSAIAATAEASLAAKFAVSLLMPTLAPEAAPALAPRVGARLILTASADREL
jgi:hypothetical protein